MVPILPAADLSTLNIDRQQPIQAQLHRQLVEWICSGRLAPGIQLTSSRQLAEQLAISRNSVTQVLEQLKAEGFLCSQVGKGVFVSPDLPSHTRAPDSPPWLQKLQLPPLSQMGETLHRFSHSISHSLPFTPGVPDLSAFPSKIWSSLYRRHSDRQSLMGIEGDQGYTPLRTALAHYLQLSRGVCCTPEQIIITQGAQQAISLCAQLTLNPGDTALIENPGYRGATKAFLARQASLLPMPLKDNALDLDALAIQKSGAKILYVTPTHQYPLGGIMSARNRLALLDWAAKTKTWILEDDYDSEFCFNQRPVAALQGMAAKTPVLYMGSFSKTLFPALRLGYLVVPKELVGVFTKAKNAMSGESPLLSQAVAADFIAEGHFLRHLRRMRRLYQEKSQHFNALIHKIASPIGNSAGMHWVIETPGRDDEALRKALHRKGFGGSALSSYYIGSPEKTGLVLGFANTNSEQRVRCIRTLSTLIS